ncbi:hypothetical protein F383_25453 [Gossypium arboreum]|uniref:Uncharacterized protein n=1 Tax=Gossypium arboreum TaxID=29729 RepID=A0A0B0P107_GOSAR|nr:hypothetical protein F383_25453 [Gossypium arboreum]
MNKVAISE